jgi:hypothetical protein
VTRENALAAATSPQDFKLLLAAEGRVSTSMADVTQAAQADPPAAPPVPAPSAMPAPATELAMDPGSPYAPVNGR